MWVGKDNGALQGLLPVITHIYVASLWCMTSNTTSLFLSDPETLMYFPQSEVQCSSVKEDTYLYLRRGNNVLDLDSGIYLLSITAVVKTTLQICVFIGAEKKKTNLNIIIFTSDQNNGLKHYWIILIDAFICTLLFEAGTCGVDMPGVGSKYQNVFKNVFVSLFWIGNWTSN